MSTEQPRISDIPENHIVVVSKLGVKEYVDDMIVPFAGMKTRDWFSTHAYYCLPLVIGNQYGYGVKTLEDVVLRWDGGRGIDALAIKVYGDNQLQRWESNFGDGIVTLQLPFYFRTPNGVNMMTMDPPNFCHHGFTNLNGVIETDNLRRDFSFNIKITREREQVRIPKGTIVSAFMPIPRYFVDGFEMVDASKFYTEEQIQAEHDQGQKFTDLRNGEDKGKPHDSGRLYYKGFDADGNKFPDHQTKVKKKGK